MPKLGDIQKLDHNCELCDAPLYEELVVHPDTFGDREMLIWSDPMHQGVADKTLTPPAACIAYLASQLRAIRKEK
jgi:hypothetical protein